MTPNLENTALFFCIKPQKISHITFPWTTEWGKNSVWHLALANLVEERDRSDEQGKSQIKITEVLAVAQAASIWCCTAPSNRGPTTVSVSSTVHRTAFSQTHSSSSAMDRTQRTEPVVSQASWKRKLDSLMSKLRTVLDRGTQSGDDWTGPAWWCLKAWRRHRQQAEPAMASLCLMPTMRAWVGREAQTLITSSAVISSNDIF